MSSSSLLSINHLCPVCLNPDQHVNACGNCHAIFYCSRKCQQLDWNAHKTFCQKEDKTLAVARREKCLEIIKSNSNAIFRYLFSFNFMGMPSVLFVTEGGNQAKYVPFNVREVLNNLADFTLSEKEYAALSHAVNQTQIIKAGKRPKLENQTEQVESSRLVSKGIPVLYESVEKNYSIYVLGSNETLSLALSIQNMPRELCSVIMCDFVGSSLRSMDPSTLKGVFSVMSGISNTTSSEEKF